MIVVACHLKVEYGPGSTHNTYNSDGVQNDKVASNCRKSVNAVRFVVRLPRSDDTSGVATSIWPEDEGEYPNTQKMPRMYREIYRSGGRC
jgi:hypothetical protein